MKVDGWVNLHSPQRAGIRFNNHTFTEPAPFSLVMPPASSGIYAILAPDATCRPQPFRAIYFGESGNFLECVTEQHERYEDWTREADGAANIYVAFCLTPLLKGEQHRWVENDLIARYRPACNLKDNLAASTYQPLLGIAK